MASNILESLVALAGPALTGRVASQLGESESAVATGMRTVFATLLAGIVAKAGDTGFMRRILDLATSRDDGDAVLADPTAALSVGTAGAAGTSSAGSLLSTIFGSNASGLGALVARDSGLKASSASSLLSLAAPLVLSLLGRRAREGGLDAAGLGSMLLAERDDILRAAPSDVDRLVAGAGAAGLGGAAAGAAGLGGAAAAASGAAPRAGYVPPPAPAARAPLEPPRRGNRWLLPLLAGLAALALIWFFMRRGDGTPDVATPDSVAVAPVGAAVDSGVTGAAATVGGAAADLGAFTRRELPGGAALNIPERGVENRLLAFITDANRAVSDTVWFDFDRLLFETGSARLAASSQEQLGNVAEILKAYPDVNLKIGGYTDDVGDDAANMRLSQERADAVVADLVGRGIAAGRLEAEGYGEQHPVGDNTTEAGRAQNRRIAMRVTKK